VSEKLGGKGGGTVTEGIKAASSEYKSLSASDREVCRARSCGFLHGQL
jgi:hypothetical protein